MMRQEMVKRIEELDRAQDYALDRYYTQEIQKLKKELEAVEG